MDVIVYMKSHNIEMDFVRLLRDLTAGEYVLPQGTNNTLKRYCEVCVKLMDCCIKEYELMMENIGIDGSTMNQYLQIIESKEMAQHAITLIEQVKALA